MSEDLWIEAHNIAREAGNKTIPKEKKSKKPKWLSEEWLQIAEERREVKSQGERKGAPVKHRVPKNSKERQEALLQ